MVAYLAHVGLSPQRFAPMVNIQQFYVEEFAHQAATLRGNLTQVSWSSRVETVAPQLHGVQVQVQTPQGTRSVLADWVVACDGGRSTVREQLGLVLEQRGMPVWQ